VDVAFGPEVSTSGFPEQTANQSARYPGTDAFNNKWHHAAIVFKGGQLKCYEDQYRVLVIPDVGTYKPASISFGGIGDLESPLMFSNVRIANGGGMMMIDKLTKHGRIVTHGILFDVKQVLIEQGVDASRLTLPFRSALCRADRPKRWTADRRAFLNASRALYKLANRPSTCESLSGLVVSLSDPSEQPPAPSYR
jgi:hypothetical protein